MKRKSIEPARVHVELQFSQDAGTVHDPVMTSVRAALVVALAEICAKYNLRETHSIHSAVKRIAAVILVVGALVASSCTNHVPPNLSPPAVKAFHQHEVQKVLDLIRDIAQDGQATVPSVVSLDTARKVTLWHQSAITIVHTAGAGWQALVATSLEETVKNLPEHERTLLAPYVALAKTILAEV